MTNAEIEAFLAVAEHKSISKAAEVLFINQSSLSTKIKTLESQIGFCLFIRAKGSRGIALTDKGKKFLPLAIKYQSIINEMMAIGSENAPKKLRVSSVNSTSTYLFMPVYDQFMLKMPNVILETQDLESRPAYTNMEAGLTDIAFTTKEIATKKFVSFPAFSEPLVFVCYTSSNYKSPVNLLDLDIKNEIYIPWSNDFEQWHIDKFGEWHQPKIQLQTMNQLEFFLRKPDKWALVPASAAFSLIKSRDIVKHVINFTVPAKVTYCVHVRDKQKQDLISCFLDCLREHLEEMTETDIKIYI